MKTMKKMITMAGLMLAAVMMTACMSASEKNKMREDNSPQTTTVRTVKPFTKVRVDAVCNVFFTQGDSTKVVVKGRQNSVARLKTGVKNGELCIDWEEKSVLGDFFTKNVCVYVTAPTLEAISVYGTGDFVADKRLDADSLSVFLSGTGDVNLAGVVCRDISVGLEGVGDINIKNLACEKSDIRLRGTGDINVKEIDVKRTEIRLEGVGDVNVDFQDCGTAVCDLNGVGDVTLKGSLRSLSERRNGVGDINTGGLKVAR